MSVSRLIYQDYRRYRATGWLRLPAFLAQCFWASCVYRDAHDLFERSCIEGAASRRDGCEQLGGPYAAGGDRRRALVVVAHPDDETLAMGGTVARLADEGWEVTIISATRGESAYVWDGSVTTREAAGAVREQELYHACSVLGVHDVRLLGFPDGKLEEVAEGSLAAALGVVMATTRPAVVLTWDARGGYGHPDHCAVHRAVTLAFFLRLSGTPEAPASLYYTTVAPTQTPRFILRWVRSRLGTTVRGHWGHWQYGIPFTHTRITTAIDVSAHAEIRMRALLRYRSQLPPGGLTTPAGSPSFGGLGLTFSDFEYFHRAFPPTAAGDPRESRFFDSVEPAVGHHPHALRQDSCRYGDDLAQQ